MTELPNQQGDLGGVPDLVRHHVPQQLVEGDGVAGGVILHQLDWTREIGATGQKGAGLLAHLLTVPSDPAQVVLLGPGLHPVMGVAASDAVPQRDAVDPVVLYVHHMQQEVLDIAKAVSLDQRSVQIGGRKRPQKVPELLART